MLEVIIALVNKINSQSWEFRDLQREIKELKQKLDQQS